MEQKYFMHRIKHNSQSNAWDKGIEVKDTLSAAQQSYHAYLGAYAYEHDEAIDMVSCMITDIYGTIIDPYQETWLRNTPVVEEQAEE